MLCPENGDYYLSPPYWMVNMLKSLLSPEIYDHVMLLNDGAEKKQGYAPVITYLKEHGL